MAAPLKRNIDQNLLYLNAVGGEEHVRLGMYIASTKISSEYAPFGSGLGSFGSFASIINNPISDGYFDYRFNDLYYRHGIDDLAGNSEDRSREGGNTMLDTYWPHILGELGIFGLLIIFSDACFAATGHLQPRLPRDQKKLGWKPKTVHVC